MERNIIDPEMEYSDNPYCVTETIPEDIRNMTFEELERAIAEEESKIQNRKKVSTHRSAGFRGSQIRPVENSNIRNEYDNYHFEFPYANRELSEEEEAERQRKHAENLKMAEELKKEFKNKYGK